MRRSGSAVLIVAMLTVFLTAAPARAGVGVTCGGWARATERAYANPCVERTASWAVRGRGKIQVDSMRGIEYVAVTAQLQRSSDGTSWSTIRSNVCGWYEVSTEAPGQICNTAWADVSPGDLYRGRVHVSVFLSNGNTLSSSFLVSPVTS